MRLSLKRFDRFALYSLPVTLFWLMCVGICERRRERRQSRIEQRGEWDWKKNLVSLLEHALSPPVFTFAAHRQAQLDDKRLD